MIKLTARKLPLMNQRLEYEHYRRVSQEPSFRAQFNSDDDRQFECGKFLWAGREEGATVLLQRIVLGLEARIPVAVMLELGCQGRLTKELIQKLSDPFQLGGRGTADCYYNRAPSLIDPRFALKTADCDLWGLVSTFYRNIRNPIFHGSYIVDLNAEKFDFIFSVFDRVYTWCDTWCDFTARFNEVGSGKFTINKEPNNEEGY